MALTHSFVSAVADGPNDGRVRPSDWNAAHVGILETSKGGTGVDTSSSTGVPKIAAGVWSVSPTLSASLGGTGQDTSAWSGLPTLNAGVWTQNNVLIANRVLYAATGNTIASNANLVFDGTNFGIGTPAPGAPLHIYTTSGHAFERIEETAAGSVAFLALVANSGAGQTEWDISHRGTADTTNNRLQFLYGGQNKAAIDPSGNFGIGTPAPGALLDLGLAGTTLGVCRYEGNTSGYVEIAASAAAGSWRMTLPTGAGTNGFQLTTDGTGVTSWTAASCVRADKEILGTANRDLALRRVLDLSVYEYRYRAGRGTLDASTIYVGPMADEAPWMMHHAGRVFSDISGFGHAVLAIQALHVEIATLRTQIVDLQTRRN